MRGGPVALGLACEPRRVNSALACDRTVIQRNPDRITSWPRWSVPQYHLRTPESSDLALAITGGTPEASNPSWDTEQGSNTIGMYLGAGQMTSWVQEYLDVKKVSWARESWIVGWAETHVRRTWSVRGAAGLPKGLLHRAASMFACHGAPGRRAWYSC